MPKIGKPETVTFTYSPDEITKLIIQDLAEHHGISAAASDIKVHFIGGYKYDANAGYRGGRRAPWLPDPVEFKGFNGTGKAK